MQISLIIPAGGSGVRFSKSLSERQKKKRKTKVAKSPLKLFVELEGKPLLAYALHSFQKIPSIGETIIAVPSGTETQVRQLVKKNGWRNVKVTRGGKTRAQSVSRALAKTSTRSSWVMVHDGARPFVSVNSIQKLIKKGTKREGAILARKVVPTIKEVRVGSKIERTVDRNYLYEAETPQLIKRNLLKKAFEDSKKAMKATDEASLLEALGKEVHVVAHEDWNPKITTVQDYDLAKAFLRKGKPATDLSRMGFGRDTHRLVEKRKFYLGGVLIPHTKGPLGHSDGDALLHAITDAVLGATGQGDIGDWFSDQNKKFKNIRSEKMLEQVYKSTSDLGWQVLHVDTVITLEKPKLKNYKEKIRKKIAKILKMNSHDISVKAKTNEGLGPEGRGEAITCEALVTLIRKDHD